MYRFVYNLFTPIVLIRLTDRLQACMYYILYMINVFRSVYMSYNISSQEKLLFYYPYISIDACTHNL